MRAAWSPPTFPLQPTLGHPKRDHLPARPFPWFLRTTARAVESGALRDRSAVMAAPRSPQRYRLDDVTQIPRSALPATRYVLTETCGALPRRRTCTPCATTLVRPCGAATSSAAPHEAAQALGTPEPGCERKRAVIAFLENCALNARRSGATVATIAPPQEGEPAFPRRGGRASASHAATVVE